MAFPKRYLRQIVVGGETYLWYLKFFCDVWDEPKHIAVRHSNPSLSGQLLLLDPNPHYYHNACGYEFEIRPKMVREAMEFALASGWTPLQKAKPLYIGFDKGNFVVLPAGEHYLGIFGNRPQ